MSQAVVSVIGADRVAATLRAAGDKLHQLGPEHAAIGAQLVARARAGVPNTTGRGTGALARSIRADAAPLSVTIKPSRPYATVIEAGTRGGPGRGPHNIRASRYMARTLDGAQQLAVDRIHGAVTDAVATVKGA